MSIFKLYKQNIKVITNLLNIMVKMLKYCIYIILLDDNISNELISYNILNDIGDILIKNINNIEIVELSVNILIHLNINKRIYIIYYRKKEFIIKRI